MTKSKLILTVRKKYLHGSSEIIDNYSDKSLEDFNK